MIIHHPLRTSIFVVFDNNIDHLHNPKMMNTPFSAFQKIRFFRFSLLLGFLFSLATAKAQIPVEVMFGDEQLQHQFFFFRDLDRNQKVNLFNMTRFSMDYENRIFNNSLVTSQLAYNLTPFLGISGGVTFADNRLSPLAAISLTYLNKKQDLFLTLFPSVVFNEETNFEMSGIFLYTPQLTKDFKLFTQVIFASTFNRQMDTHLFSNQQCRIGVDYKDLFQVGIGIDQTYINTGEGYLKPRNIGIFFRKEL